LFNRPIKALTSGSSRPLEGRCLSRRSSARRVLNVNTTNSNENVAAHISPRNSVRRIDASISRHLSTRSIPLRRLRESALFSRVIRRCSTCLAADGTPHVPAADYFLWLCYSGRLNGHSGASAICRLGSPSVGFALRPSIWRDVQKTRPKYLETDSGNGKKFIDQAQLVEADRVIVKAAEIYED